MSKVKHPNNKHLLTDKGKARREKKLAKLNEEFSILLRDGACDEACMLVMFKIEMLSLELEGKAPKRAYRYG